MATRLVVVTALAVAVAVAVASSAASAAKPRVLVARVGLHDAFTISLTFPNGRRVRSVKAGRYTIVVHDHSKVHNFALGSPTEQRRIFTGSVPRVGTRRYTVRLRPGVYVYACSAHPQTMNGRFLVRR